MTSFDINQRPQVNGNQWVYSIVIIICSNKSTSTDQCITVCHECSRHSVFILVNKTWRTSYGSLLSHMHRSVYLIRPPSRIPTKLYITKGIHQLSRDQLMLDVIRIHPNTKAKGVRIDGTMVKTKLIVRFLFVFCIDGWWMRAVIES